MNDYIVLYWKVMDRKNIVLSREFKNYDEALAFSKFKKEERLEVLLIENLKKEINNSQSYKVHKFGYYKEYKFFSQTIYFIFIFGLLILYLYYKFVK